MADEQRELVIARTLKAPRPLVWRTFEDPYLLAQWWGPEGFTCPVLELDFRVGGEWYTVMRGPDGNEYPARYTFDEIVPPERISYHSAVSDGAVWRGNPPPRHTATVTFEEEDGHTRLTIRAVFQSVEHMQESIRRGFAVGTNQSLDRLQDLIVRPD